MDARSAQTHSTLAAAQWFWRQWFWHLIDAARQNRQRKLLTPDAALGRRGEDLAHRYLRHAGMTILARNYRTPSLSGEIDIIAREGDVVVFVEVKSRTTADYGAPDRAIDAEKQHRITLAAHQYVGHTGAAWDHVRFDIVSIIVGNPPTLTHYPDAFFEGRSR